MSEGTFFWTVETILNAAATKISYTIKVYSKSEQEGRKLRFESPFFWNRETEKKNAGFSSVMVCEGFI